MASGLPPVSFSRVVICFKNGRSGRGLAVWWPSLRPGQRASLAVGSARNSYNRGLLSCLEHHFELNVGMQNLVFALLLVSGSVQAQFQCLDFFRMDVYESSQVRPVTFKEVEVYRRNNRLGPQQMGTLVLEKWIEIGPYQEGIYNYVGLTRDGKLYHLIEWPQRRIARLLGGERPFADLFLVRNEVLGAIDRDGQVFLYSPARWQNSRMTDLITRAGAIWGSLTISLTAAVSLISPEALNMYLHLGDVPLPLLPAFVATTGFLSTGFAALGRYEHINTFPDGMVLSRFQAVTVYDLQRQLLAMTPDDIMPYESFTHLQPPSFQGLDPRLAPELTEDIR